LDKFLAFCRFLAIKSRKSGLVTQFRCTPHKNMTPLYLKGSVKNYQRRRFTLNIRKNWRAQRCCALQAVRHISFSYLELINFFTEGPSIAELDDHHEIANSLYYDPQI
jgi:hypothetical protein